MPFCSFAEGAGMYDVTPIENMFLLEYLPTAPDGYLRVYLYARMICLHPELGDGMEEMAQALHMDADGVYNAMLYWERQGLVVRMSDRPPTYAVLPMRGEAAMMNPMESDYYKYREFHSNLQALLGENLLHPKQEEMAHDWVELLGFSQEAVLRMVEGKLGNRRGRKIDVYKFFDKLNKTAALWADRGVSSAEDVERALLYDGQVEKTASAVMKQLSMHRQATVEESKLVACWLNDWGFTHEEILEACADTTKSRAPSMAYLNSILESRRKGEGPLFEGVKAVLRELGAPETPTPYQVERYGKLLEAGFEPQTILLAAVQCSRKKKHRFEELEWMVGKWAEMKLFRYDEAEAYVQDRNRVTDEVRALLEKCGTDRRPQMDDLALYERWCSAHSQQLIDYAAQCAHGMQLPMRYIDRLLTEWQRAGVRTVDEARAQHEGNRGQRQSGGAPAVNPALNYEQREKSEADYNDLFIDLDSFGGEGDA